MMLYHVVLIIVLFLTSHDPSHVAVTAASSSAELPRITRLSPLNCSVDKGYLYRTTTKVQRPSPNMLHFLGHLCGIEIGPAAHAPAYVPTVNVGISEQLDPTLYREFKQLELGESGAYAKIDIAAYGDDLHMFGNDSVDFVLNAHVWEHFPDPLRVLEEWVRVVRPDGILFLVVPHHGALPEDAVRPLTTITQLQQYYDVRATESHPDFEKLSLKTPRNHFTIFSADLLFQIMDWFNNKHCPGCVMDGSQSEGKGVYLSLLAFLLIDDRVGNGHQIVWQVRKL